MNQPARFLPYGRQSVTEEDIAAVVAVLRSDWLTQGPEVERFEEDLAKAVGARHVVTFTNGTAALFAACFAAGIGPADEVITSTLTFSASANCARYVGARAVFADVEPTAGTLDPAAFERAITKKTRAVIPVHYAGQPADLAAICAIAERHDLWVIDDAAHALGGLYRGKPIGHSDLTDMTMLSFHPVKHITTGEGGAIATGSAELYEKLKLFRTHGITKDPRFLTSPSPGPWYAEQILLGHNLRLTDIQCALGRSQLRRLPELVARRRALAALYDEALQGLPFLKPLGRLVAPETLHAFHLYPVLIDFERLGKTRADVMKALRAKEIGTQVHYIPVHMHPYYEREGYERGAFPVAEGLYEQLLSVPLFPAMLDSDVAYVVSALREVLGA